MIGLKLVILGHQITLIGLLVTPNQDFGIVYLGLAVSLLGVFSTKFGFLDGNEDTEETKTDTGDSGAR